jgi:lysyl-tRNA synthetase class 2
MEIKPMQQAIITDDIFSTFPDFYRGLVIVEGARLERENPEISRLLASVAQDRIGTDVAAIPEIRTWEEAYRKFNANPNKHPPSVKGLLKRAANGHNIPFINSAVALFNIISIKYALPGGGDDLDKVRGELTLGVSDGSETFIPLGGEGQVECPLPGEVIYFAGKSKQVMCRRWNWRNGDNTKIDLSTTNMVINVDCLPPVDPALANLARNELASLFETFCGAYARVSFLNRQQRSAQVNLVRAP